MRGLPALGLALLAVSCAAPPPPPPPPPPAPPPEVRRAPRPPLDWFQRQLVAANAARRSHHPASDKAGAQQAYDAVLQSACQRVAIEGPDRYKARCDQVLKAPPRTPEATPADPFGCESATDDATLQACND